MKPAFPMVAAVFAHPAFFSGMATGRTAIALSVLTLAAMYIDRLPVSTTITTALPVLGAI